MNYPNFVKINDVGARDGLQNEKQTVPIDVKIELINGLLMQGCANLKPLALCRQSGYHKWQTMMPY